MSVKEINFQKFKDKNTSKNMSAAKTNARRAPKVIKSVFEHESTPGQYQRTTSLANEEMRLACTTHNINAAFLYCLKKSCNYNEVVNNGLESVNNFNDENNCFINVSNNLNGTFSNMHNAIADKSLNVNSNQTPAGLNLMEHDRSETPTKRYPSDSKSPVSRCLLHNDENCFPTSRTHITVDKTLTLLNFTECNRTYEPELDTLSQEFYEHNVRVSNHQAIQIEASTREQSKNPLWYAARSVRLTSSRFGDVISRKKTDVTKLIDSILNGKDISHLPAVKAGQEAESTIAEHYKLYKNQNSCPGTEVFCSGLIINPNYPWLAASPDRIVYDPSSSPAIGGLECKFIPSAQGLTPLQAYDDKKYNKKCFCLELEKGSLSLKKTHKYFYQIQGQCAIANYSWVDLALMTDPQLHDSGFFLQRIYCDKVKWESEWLPKLTEFYFKELLPRVVTKDNTSNRLA